MFRLRLKQKKKKYLYFFIAHLTSNFLLIV